MCFSNIDVNVSAVKAMNLNLATSTVNQLEVVGKWAKDF